MKLQGYEPGTELQWLNKTQEGFRTGIVRAQYYDPNITEINGETIEIKLVYDSPVFNIEQRKTGTVIVIEQAKVTLRSSNE